MRLVITAAALFVTAAHAAPTAARALIWAGGATAEEGATAMKSFDAAAERVRGLLTLAPGFPKQIESKSVRGLKPGFHVVLLGFCRDADAVLPLGALKSVAPTVYMRAVEVEPGDVACPSLKAPVEVASTTTASAGELVLTAKLLQGVPQSWLALVALTDKQGEFLDFLVVDDHVLCPGGNGAETPKFIQDKSGLSLSSTCWYPGCTTPSWATVGGTIGVKGKRITRAFAEGQYHRGECD